MKSKTIGQNKGIEIAAALALDFQKIRGLIAADKPRSILLQTRFGIHTFGLKFPIDVAVIDRENVVRAIKHDLKPNRIFLWSPKYDRILEIPVGTLNEKGIKKGEKLTLILQKT